tara:strand:- start:3966 stop:4535 length:570 start_codon:yes stop_codon:yes gene_type:complete
MSFTHRFERGDTVSGANVQSNFNDIKSAVEGVKRSQVIPGALLLRHRAHLTQSGAAGATYASGKDPWKYLEQETNASPGAGAAAGKKLVPSGTPTWNTVPGQLVAMVFGCEVIASGGAQNQHVFQVRVNGSVVRTQEVYLDVNQRKMFTTHYYYEAAGGVADIVDLFATESGNNGSYENAFAYSMAFSR